MKYLKILESVSPTTIILLGITIVRYFLENVPKLIEDWEPLFKRIFKKKKHGKRNN